MVQKHKGIYATLQFFPLWYSKSILESVDVKDIKYCKGVTTCVIS